LSTTVGNNVAVNVFLRVAVAVTRSTAASRHAVLGDDDTSTIFTTVPGVANLFATTAVINIAKTHVGRVDNISFGTVGNAAVIFIEERINLSVNSVLLRA